MLKLWVTWSGSSVQPLSEEPTASTSLHTLVWMTALISTWLPSVASTVAVSQLLLTTAVFSSVLEPA